MYWVVIDDQVGFEASVAPVDTVFELSQELFPSLPVGGLVNLEDQSVIQAVGNGSIDAHVVQSLRVHAVPYWILWMLPCPCYFLPPEVVGRLIREYDWLLLRQQ